MKKIFLSLLLLCLPLCGNAQSSAQRFYTALLPNPQGENFVAVIPNASVYVCVDNDEDQCNTPIGIYADSALTQPIVQPLLADGNGVYSYYIQSGTKVVEKVCAPYDQCASYRLQIGDTGVGGGGSGTVTDVACDNLHPLFGCSVSSSTTTPVVQFTLDTAQSLGFWGNVDDSTGTPSYITLIAGNNITFTRDFASSPNTLTINASGGVAGGCVGTLAGDDTSTDCGFGNQVPTIFSPAFVSTFGYLNADSASGSEIVAMGDENADSNIGSNAVMIGSHNGTANTDDRTVYIGASNASHVVNRTGNDTRAVMIGDSNAFWDGTNPCVVKNSVMIGNDNDNPCFSRVVGGTRIEDNVAIGDSNLLFNNTTPTDVYVGGTVAIGQQNIYDSGNVPVVICCTTAVGQFNINNLKGQSNELVAVGDTNLYGGDVDGSNLVDITAVGDQNVQGLADGSHDVVGIGDVNMDTSVGTSLLSFAVSLGFSNLSGASGHDLIAIGDTAVAGGHVAGSFYNSGNEIIGIGDTACATNTTGNDNICIGDQAGVPDYNTNTGNKTGSHNVYIGDTAGPTGTGFSNDIALGYQASITQDNETVIGNPSTTLSIIYGFLQVNAGTNVVYRCATSGALPAGTLTITSGSCGTTVDTGLRVQ